MVSGFHGNIDPIMVTFLFFAAVAVVKDRPVLCGVMYAVACNIKIVPLTGGAGVHFLLDDEGAA